MFDLQVLAFQADIDARHQHDHVARAQPAELPEHRRARAAPRASRITAATRSSIAKKARIDTYHVQLLAEFLRASCRRRRTATASLLDHSLVLYGGGMGDGNLHRHHEPALPHARQARRRVQDGPARRYPEDTPMTNLLLTMLDKVGVHARASSATARAARSRPAIGLRRRVRLAVAFQVLRFPDAVAAGRQDAVRIDGVLDLLLQLRSA